MATLSESALLNMWEQGAGQATTSRAVMMASIVGEASYAGISGLPLGVRNEMIMTLRRQCFGEALSCVVTCPGCGEELDVSIGLDELLVAQPVARDQQELSIDIDGVPVTYRPLTSQDVLAVKPGSPSGRRELVRRCVTTVNSRAVASDEVPDRVIEAVAALLAKADPQADLLIPLTCAVCGQAWRAPLDIAEQVWAELDLCARRLLSDVHCLATAYGWRESDVLSVSPARRRFYLEASGS